MKLSFLAIVATLISNVYCAEKPLNILGIFQHEFLSHSFVFDPYLTELAKRGHNVTVISHFPQKSPLKNYHDISLAGTAKIIESHFDVKDLSFIETLYLSTFLFDKGIVNCQKLLENESVQKLWKSKQKFDVIIFEMFNSDCALGLAHQFKAPTVGITSCALLPMQYKRFGIPYNPSYVPVIALGGGFHPTLFQKVKSIIADAFYNVLYTYYQQPTDQRTLAKYFKDVPPLENLAKEIKFLLLNHNFPLTGSRLFPANVIEVGGIHVTKPKPLIGELLKFVEGAEHGVIFISLGSMLRATTIPPEKLQAILGAISKLPQRIVWKWSNATLPGNPKNVFVSSWLPQNDILAHPKVVAFYSHAGMLSSIETIQHGVPVIVTPIFGDQPSNAAAVEDCGLGVQLLISNLNEENLSEALKKIMAPKFRENVKQLSKAWNDRPQSAMDTAIFWTEFAAKHANLTFRARSADVPLYEYLCLDILLVFSLAILLVVYLVTKLFSSVCKKKQTKPKKSKTK